MRVAVIGERGQLASSLREVAGLQWTFLGRSTVDCCSSTSLSASLERFRPDVVLNTAAYTAVDKAELESEAAFALNEAAPRAMAQWCAIAGVPFVHISTDYVFDGSGERPWQEDDEPRPLNVYGASKLAGERAVLGSGARTLVLRTSWVHSPHGSNFLKTMLKLAAQRDRLAIVADQRGSPTSAQDLAYTITVLLPLLLAGKVNGLYHCSGGGVTDWASFAEAIFAAALESGLLEKAPAVDRIASADYAVAARRPLNSVLSSNRLLTETGVGLPGWRIGLQRTLAALAKEKTS